MLHRLLNVVSVICLVACVAFMALWVRSYRMWYELPGRYSATRAFQIVWEDGRLMLFEFPVDSYSEKLLLQVPKPWPWTEGGQPIGLQTESGPPVRFEAPPWTRGRLTPLGFVMYVRRTGSFLMLPYWFLVLVSGSLAIVLRLRWPWRFTLRSLFIATTFLAVVLGMIAWLDRAWIGK
jgi:hypothetical protein